MSDIKSFQRLFAVQALYEVSINANVKDTSLDNLLTYIIENSDLKKKITRSKLILTKEIYNGVISNMGKIDTILKNSLNKKSKLQSFDKLLLSIFRSAIYEIEIKKEISKKIVISEYLLISNHFFGNKEAMIINGVLDNLREI